MVPANLYICGSSAALPSKHNSTTAQVLTVGGIPHLIDAGESVQERLREASVRFQKIPAVFISHLHGDHVLGLPGLIGTMNLLGRTSPLKIIGPVGTKELIDTIHRCTGTFLRFPLQIEEISGRRGELLKVHESDALLVYAFQVHHRISTFGYRFDLKPGKRRIRKDAIETFKLKVQEIRQLITGRDVRREDGTLLSPNNCCEPMADAASYVYAADTRPCDAVAQAAKQATLLYHEATFMERDRNLAVKTHHSTAYEAGQIAAQAQVDRLILGHFSTRYPDPLALAKEATQAFEGPVDLALRGCRFDLQG